MWRVLSSAEFMGAGEIVPRSRPLSRSPGIGFRERERGRGTRTIKLVTPRLCQTLQRLRTFLCLGGHLHRSVCFPVYGLASSATVSAPVMISRQRAVIKAPRTLQGVTGEGRWHPGSVKREHTKGWKDVSHP